MDIKYIPYWNLKNHSLSWGLEELCALPYMNLIIDAAFPKNREVILIVIKTGDDVPKEEISERFPDYSTITVGLNFLSHYGLVHHFVNWGNKCTNQF